ncbi:hypothetical protein D6C85_00549 [Aureobasidium pullulans]|uniref:Uncharacterized protein n=1 Tax=Aureobasidium pullulans TaxID=5580 RepID=A0A4S9XJB5_AURPU|nr:hypothetical protein D6C85_00549 [Aureobasidium pullulans]
MESSAAYFAVSRQDLLGKAPIKPARNVYFIALKDTNLMMYDNSEKLEVRHAIPLENYDVDMLPDARQEDITGSYIRLYPRSANGDIYCLFSNNYVEKTTCYRALQWACGSAYDGTFDKVQDEHLDESEEDSVTQTSAIETADESDDDYVSPRFAPEHQMPPSPFSQAITHVQPQSPDSDTGSTALSISSTADISEDDVTSPIKPSSSLDHARYVDHPDIQQGPDRRPKDKAFVLISLSDCVKALIWHSIDTPNSLEYATKPLDGDSAGAINPSTTNIDGKGFDIGDVEAGMSTDYQAFSKDRASQVSETEARSSVTFSTVSGISRLLTQEEAWLLYDFETHCRDCRHCISPYKRFQSGAPLCHKGKHMSYRISESMYMQKGNVFERYHHHTKPMRVEIPHTYTYLREQLHAMEDAAAIRHARRQTEEERPRVGVHNDSQRHSDKPLVSSSTGTVIEAARTDDRRRARYRHEPHEQTKAPLELEGSPLHGEARLRALDASVKVREQNYRAQDRRPTWAEEDVRARQ